MSRIPDSTLGESLVFGLPGCGLNCIFTYMIFLKFIGKSRHMGTIIYDNVFFHTSKKHLRWRRV